MARKAMELEFDCLKQGERTTNFLLDSERYLQKTVLDRNCNCLLYTSDAADE